MKAVILAGGEGTRLQEIAGGLSKPMMPILGKPMLERIVALLKEHGFEDICMTLRYKPELIKDHFGDGRDYGVNIEYRIEQEALGTAGAVKNCLDFVKNEDFLVISGDCACDFDLKQLMEAHRRHRPAVTMALYAHPSPLAYGCVLTDRRNRVVSFTEKPRWEQVVTDLVNTGIYMVSPAAMELVPADTMFDFSKDLFPRLMEEGQTLRGLPMSGYWCDIGSPAAYHRCNLDALEGRLKLEGTAPAESAPAPQPSQPQPDGARRELLCRDRAHVMRLISLSLMEAGADFSDGLHLDTREGRVHITPSGKNESILIHAQSDSDENAAALAGKMECFVKNTLTNE